MSVSNANLIVITVFLVYGVILWSFKKFCLNRLQNKIIKYILGMVLAYGILVIFIILSNEYEFLSLAFQKARLPLFRHFRDWGIVLLVVPAIYSIYVLDYIPRSDWKSTKIMMLSLLLNGFFAFFGAIFFNSYLNGKSVKEIYELAKESACFIDWKYTSLFIVIIVLSFYLVKWKCFKNDRNK